MSCRQLGYRVINGKETVFQANAPSGDGWVCNLLHKTEQDGKGGGRVTLFEECYEESFQNLKSTR